MRASLGPPCAAQLGKPGAEFTLVGDVDVGWQFLPVDYAKHRVEQSGGPSASWQVTNQFDTQPLQVRIEALMAAGPYDDPGNQTLADFQSTDAFSQHAAQQGVSAQLGSDSEHLHAGIASGRYEAVSQRASRDAAWTKFETTFTPPKDLSDFQALGVWIHGDGQGEVLNFQLRSPEHLVGTLADHYVPIDFTGWRYFELIEPEGDRWASYQWPYGGLYSIYRESVQLSQISHLGLWYNDLPSQRPVTCYLSPIKALPLVKTRLINPTVRVGNAELTFPVEIESGCYLEFRGEDNCYLYGPEGEQLSQVTPSGSVPQSAQGANQIQFQAGTPTNVSARAYVTVITQGQPLRGE